MWVMYQQMREDYVQSSMYIQCVCNLDHITEDMATGGIGMSKFDSLCWTKNFQLYF